MMSYVYVVDCGNWRQHTAVRDPIQARDDVWLQPRNASLEKSKCGLAGGVEERGGAEDGGELIRCSRRPTAYPVLGIQRGPTVGNTALHLHPQIIQLVAVRHSGWHGAES